jgi:hypothetical protein
LVTPETLELTWPPKNHEVDEHLPIKPVDFLALMTLARGERHV